MNNSEEIKELLVKKDYKSALLVAFSNSLKFTLTSKIDNLEKSTSIATEIDLLKGLTTTASDANLLDQNHELMQFHQQQLQKIPEIWAKNRQVLVKLIEIIAGNQIDKIDSVNSLDLSNSVTRTIAVQEETENKSSNDLVNFAVLEDESEIEQPKQNTSFNIDNELSDDLSAVIIEPEDDEIEEEIIISAQRQEEAQESWNEFMGDLSVEEEAVSEVVVVKDSDDEEISDDWSEWLEDDDSQTGDSGEEIDWSQEYGEDDKAVKN